MATWWCGECGTEYSVGAPRCPQCQACDPVREDAQLRRENDEMAKITVHGGPSNADDEQPVDVEREATTDATEQAAVAAAADESEQAAAQAGETSEEPKADESKAEAEEPKAPARKSTSKRST